MTVISPKYSQWEYQNLALAGIAQCAYLVNSLANGGGASEYNLAASINPLLALNPRSVEDVYSMMSSAASEALESACIVSTASPDRTLASLVTPLVALALPEI